MSAPIDSRSSHPALRRAEGFLLSPMFLICIVVWAANDHIFKRVSPGWFTGKLSDFGALAAAPVILFALADWVAPRVVARAPGRFLMISSALVAGLMIGIKTNDAIARTYEYAFGLVYHPWRAAAAVLHDAPVPAVTPVVSEQDPSDLVSLVALAIPLALWAKARCSRAWRGEGCPTKV